jgi:hypothetical protein
VNSSRLVFPFFLGKLPTYSRALSDPVPGGVELSKSHRVVIVEGNYMLNYDDKLWEPLKDLFDEKVIDEKMIKAITLPEVPIIFILFCLHSSGTYPANLWTSSGAG